MTKQEHIVNITTWILSGIAVGLMLYSIWTYRPILFGAAFGILIVGFLVYHGYHFIRGTKDE